MKCQKKCFIVRKGASALPFFFHPPPVLDIPLSLETCNPSPLHPPSTVLTPPITGKYQIL